MQVVTFWGPQGLHTGFASPTSQQSSNDLPLSRWQAKFVGDSIFGGMVWAYALRVSAAAVGFWHSAGCLLMLPFILRLPHIAVCPASL